MEFHYKPQTFLGSYMSTVRNSIITLSFMRNDSFPFPKTKKRLATRVRAVMIRLFFMV